MEVASLDHGLRPKARREVAEVEERCRVLELPFHGLRLDPPLEDGSGLQARARWARRQRLEALRECRSLDRICLGHTQDDQAETFLAQLLRGSGLRGLSGMGEFFVSGWRPLLEVPRSHLRQYLQSRGESWIEDPSNQDPRFLRSRLRHQALPLLEEIRPGAIQVLARSARVLAEESGLLEEFCREDLRKLGYLRVRSEMNPEALPEGGRGYELDRARYRNLGSARRHRLLATVSRELLGRVLGRQGILELDQLLVEGPGRKGQRQRTRAGLRVELGGEKAWIEPEDPEFAASGDPWVSPWGDPPGTC